jgi:hypothetical protein
LVFNFCTRGTVQRACGSTLSIPLIDVRATATTAAGTIPTLTCCGLAVLLTLGLTGCSESPTQTKAIDPAASEAASKEESRRKLGSAIQRIQPESMAVQARRELVVNGLNSWLATNAENDVEKLKISAQNAAKLSPAALRTASAVRFSENDVVYIRDCLLLKSLSESIWEETDSTVSGGQASDRERIVAMFRHLVRNVALLRPDENRVPVGLYEALLTGRGTVEDRVWAFAEALRQRSIDTVILKAATPGDPAASELALATDMLVGVVAGNEILLFDPLRGTAVPKPDDKNAVVLDPAGLDALAGMERWSAATPLVVCHPSAFAPRMLVLQERLEAADSAILYEELLGGTSEIRPLLERLNDAIGKVWPADAVKVWEVPEQRIAAAAALTEQQKQEFTLLMRPLDSPFERESVNVGNLIDDPNVNQEELTLDQKAALKMAALEKLLERSDALFGKPSRRLLTTRVQQIMGSFDVGMIQDLQQIRIASLQEKVELEIPVDEKKAMVVPFKLPQTILDVQRNAVGDTLYWTSMTQMSRNDMGAAVATLRNYRRQYPAEKLVFPSLTCEAEALLQLGDSKNATLVLQEADVAENPEQLRAQWLLARLASGEPPAATPAATPAEANPPAATPAEAEPEPAAAAEPAAPATDPVPAAEPTSTTETEAPK